MDGPIFWVSWFRVMFGYLICLTWWFIRILFDWLFCPGLCTSLLFCWRSLPSLCTQNRLAFTLFSRNFLPLRWSFSVYLRFFNLTKHFIYKTNWMKLLLLFFMLFPLIFCVKVVFSLKRFLRDQWGWLRDLNYYC